MPVALEKLRWQRPWVDKGESWSRRWGGVMPQWHVSIMPRICQFLPFGVTLEIAPGFGRWTEFLRSYSERVIGVDFSSICVDGCRERFADDPRMSFHLNDGISLAAIPDESIDFVFSFDSLVHCGPDVLQSYLKQLRFKMKPDAVAFIHHSNMGAYPVTQRNMHGRSRQVSAALVAEWCEQSELECLTQEIVPWGGPVLNDCFSTIARRGSKWGSNGLVFETPEFMEQADALARLLQQYHLPRDSVSPSPEPDEAKT